MPVLVSRCASASRKRAAPFTSPALSARAHPRADSPTAFETIERYSARTLRGGGGMTCATAGIEDDDRQRTASVRRTRSRMVQDMVRLRDDREAGEPRAAAGLVVSDAEAGSPVSIVG